MEYLKNCAYIKQTWKIATNQKDSSEKRMS